VPSPENPVTQSTQSGSTEVETGVEDRESSASGDGGNTQGVEQEPAKVPTVKEGPNGSGEAIATTESGSPPVGPVVDETLPQGAEGVDKVHWDGATKPDEPKYPGDPAVLKRLLEQKDQLIKELLAENRKLKEEVEYLREQLTEDTTV
jgi:hypothetical protein